MEEHPLIKDGIGGGILCPLYPILLITLLQPQQQQRPFTPILYIITIIDLKPFLN